MGRTYNIKKMMTGSYEILFSILILAVILISGCTGNSTQAVSPHEVTLSFVDVFGNPLVGAQISAAYNSTTASSGVSNPNSQSGTTDTSGNIVFIMSSNVKYDVILTYDGNQQSYQIYPQYDFYQLRFHPPATVDTSFQTCVKANGNTRTSSFYSSDLKYCTFVWSYQDTCGLTTKVDFYLIDADLNKIVYQNSIEDPGTTIATMKYTVENEQGKNYICYENSTRNV